MREAERVEIGAGFLLDPVATPASSPARGGLGRRLAGQPLAHHQPDRRAERHFVAAARADQRIGAQPHLGELGEIGAHPGHAARAERLDPRLLGRVEHRARDLVAGRVALVEPRIVVPQPQRGRVGEAPRLGHLLARRSTRPGIGALTLLPETAGTSLVKPSSSSASRAIARVAPASAWRKASRGLSSAIWPRAVRPCPRRFRADPCRTRADNIRPPVARSASSHLLRKVRRKAKPTSPKISAFCAQLITVRGLITVEMSPLMKPWRVRSATLIIRSTSCAAALMVIFARFGEDDPRLGLGRQVVERDDDVPAVHLALIDLLGAVIEAGRVAEADRVGGREQAEIGVRADHPVLVEQGQLALGLEHALDDEHHVGPAGIIFVEHQSGRRLQRPGQQPLAELGDLLAVAQHDRVAADQVDAADMGVEIDADGRPVEPRRDLLDMGRLAGAVIALDHHPAVLGEAGADRERRVRIEHIGRIEIGHALVGFRESRHLHVAVDPEQVAHLHHLVGRVHHRRGAAVGVHIGDVCHALSLIPACQAKIGRPLSAV